MAVFLVILSIAVFLLGAIVAFFGYYSGLATQQMKAESRRTQAVIDFEIGVVEWADGLISEDQLRSLVDGLEIDTASLASMIQAGESDLTEEDIQKVKTAKILDEL